MSIGNELVDIEEENFDTIVFGVQSEEEAYQFVTDAARLMDAGREDELEQAEFRMFASVELLWKTLTENRWRIIGKMAGAGPLGLREISRRAGRDVKGVHTDLAALAKAGVIDRTENGKYLFPYKTVKVRFELRAAA
jgi:predicted transcriptional regulator